MLNSTDRDDTRKEAIEAHRQYSAPILESLATHSIVVDTIQELVVLPLDRQRYRAAVPILLEWLPKTDDLGVKQEIVRTLSLKLAGPIAAPALIREFVNAPPFVESGLKWAIGNALAEVADDTVFESIATLALDRRHGRAREMLMIALGKMHDPRATDVLVEALDDDDVAGHALLPIGNRRARYARDKIANFLNDERAWVRRDAKRALEKIETFTK